MLAAQFILSFLALAIGSLKDLVDNTVPNLLWLVYGAIAMILAFEEYGLTALLGIHFLFAACIAIAAYVAWRVLKGKLGGADAKAVICLGLSLPIFGIIILSYAALLAFMYLAYRAIKEKMTLKDALKVKAPFLPFLFVGLVLTAVAMWFS